MELDSANCLNITPYDLGQIMGNLMLVQVGISFAMFLVIIFIYFLIVYPLHQYITAKIRDRNFQRDLVLINESIQDFD